MLWLVTKPDDIKAKTIAAIRWTVIGRLSSQLFTWVSTLLVIRLLAPSDYGLMALAMATYSILMVFATGGVAEGLIQAKTISSEQVQRILGFLVLINLVLCFAQVVFAPVAASFYNEPDVVPVMLVLALAFLFVPWENTASALLSRKMEFKHKSIIDLIVSLGSAASALILAYLGYGVWALVTSLLVKSVATALLYAFYSGAPVWPEFRFGGIGPLLRFGLYVTGGGIIWAMYLQAGVVIGGRFLTAEVIGVFAVAATISEIPVSKLMPMAHQVMMPALSRVHNDGSNVRQHAMHAVRVTSAVTFPVFFFMAAFAQEITNVVLGEKWSDVGLVLAILSLSMPFRMVMNLFPPVVRAVGRPDIALGNAAFMLVLLSALFLSLVGEGAVGLSFAWLLAAPIGSAFAVRRSAALIGSNLREVVIDTLPYLLSGLVAFGSVYSIFDAELFNASSSLVRLVFGGLIGIVIYVLLGYLFFRPRVFELFRFVKTILNR